MKNIIIVGDPIEDIYATVENGKTLEAQTVAGGALNVLLNTKQLLSATESFNGIIFIPEILSTNKYLYKILRMNNEEDIHLCETSKRENYYSNLKYEIQRQLNLAIEKSSEDSTIIFSDYNKGVLTQPCPRYKGLRKIKTAIIDSKYRSIHSHFFNYAEKYILRCTGKEYCPKFANKFDFTIWTDGPKPVVLLGRNQEILNVFEVPDVPPIDTCGAGDTFTATLASFIHEKGFSYSNIERAIELSIKSSLSVICKKRTSITNIKI